MRLLRVVFVPLLILTSLLSPSAFANSDVSIPTRAEAARMNDDTLGIVFSREELFSQLVHDLEAELESSSGLRIVPILGKNHLQSLFDLLYLKGVDMAMVRTDAIEYLRTESDFPNIQNVVQNVVKVSEEKIVVISRKEFESINDLNGQAVAIGATGSAEYITGKMMFKALEVSPDMLQMDIQTAIDRLQSNEIAAMVYLLESPDTVQTGSDLEDSKAIKSLQLGDTLRILNLPDNEELNRLYTPATLGQADLLAAIAGDQSVTTYSVDSIIAAYNWIPTHPRWERSKRFVDALVDSMDGLQNDAYQPAWKRTTLGLPTPNIETLPLLTRALEAKLAEQQRLLAEKEAAEATARAEKLVELIKIRDQLSEKLNAAFNDADTGELERILTDLNVILESD
jgi:hypothetical protein